MCVDVCPDVRIILVLVWKNCLCFSVGYQRAPGTSEKKKECLVPASASLPTAGSALPAVGRATPLLWCSDVDTKQQHQQACTLREHSTAALGFHFGGRSRKRNYCFVLTSLHQRSGVALPTGGRADPAVGNEALAGTRRSVLFSLVPGARWYPTLKPRQSFCCSS